MGKVLADNAWVGDHLVAKGTRREDIAPELAGQVGSHLWTDEAARANVDEATGEALTGLKDGVWIDGEFFAKGTIPPDEVIPKVGTHMWVQGFAPVVPEPVVSVDVPVVEVPPAPEPVEDSAEGTEARPADELVPEGAPEVPEPEDEAVESAEDEPAQDVPEPPPAAGKGSSEQAWRDYAAAVGVDIEGVEDRKGIRAKLVEAGKPV